MTPHIIFVDETSSIGGAELNLVLIASQLRAIGWKPSAIIPGEGPLAQLLRQSFTPYVFAPRPPLLSTSFYLGQRLKLPNLVAPVVNMLLGAIWVIRLRDQFARSEPAIVHTMSMWSHAFGGVAARLAGRPVVWHLQDIVAASSGLGIYRRLLRLWARYIPDRIICISQQVAEQLAADEEIAAKITVLWNTVDIARFTPAGSRPRTYQRPLQIGTVARLTPWKGHDVALQAAKLLKERGVTFNWRIAGEEALGNPGYRAHLERAINGYGLADCVQLVGWVDDIPTFYRSLDVLTHLPTDPEPFGLTLAEAMACGLTLVTTSGGGLEAMVAEAQGLLVPPADAPAVAEVIVMLADTPSEVSRRGEAARQFALSTFSVDRYIEHLTALYQELMPVDTRQVGVAKHG